MTLHCIALLIIELAYNKYQFVYAIRLPAFQAKIAMFYWKLNYNSFNWTDHVL